MYLVAAPFRWPLGCSRIARLSCSDGLGDPANRGEEEGKSKGREAPVAFYPAAARFRANG